MNGGPEIQKFIQQIEKKKEYNRSYYRTRVKPKRETEKYELELLREKCAKLESDIDRLQSGKPEGSLLMEDLKKQNQNLTSENFKLTQQIFKLTRDNTMLTQLLETARQRNYELMMQRADDLLPSLQNLTLNQ